MMCQVFKWSEMVDVGMAQFPANRLRYVTNLLWLISSADCSQSVFAGVITDQTVLCVLESAHYLMALEWTHLIKDTRLTTTHGKMHTFLKLQQKHTWWACA